MSESTWFLVAHAPRRLQDLLSERIMRIRLCRLSGYRDGLEAEHSRLVPDSDISLLLNVLEHIRYMPFEDWKFTLMPVLNQYLRQLDVEMDAEMIELLDNTMRDLLASDENYYDSTQDIREIISYIRRLNNINQE